MDNVRKFLDPILDGAVRKAKERLAITGEDKEKKWMRGDREVKEGETLLDHLTNYTDGECLWYMNI